MKRLMYLAGGFCALAFAAPLGAQQCDSAFASYVRQHTDSIKAGQARIAAILQPAFVPDLVKAASTIDSAVTQRCRTLPPPPPPPAPIPQPPPPPPSGVPSIAPTPPRDSVDVSMPSPVRTLHVRSGDNLQQVLDSARRGDEIVIEASARFTGNFVLRPKAGSGRVLVRTSALASLPPQGSRLRLSDSVYLPKIVSPNVLPALATAWQTAPSGWHFVGIEVTVAVGAAQAPNIQQGLVVIGDGVASSNPARPSDFVFDRVYVHGQSATNLKRCFAFNGASIAVIGSQVLECHGKGFDSQAIAGWDGPGPFLIENNRLEGAGEVVMFGGALAARGLVPSDIIMRRNHVTRPMAWKGKWTVKNLFELKNAQRVVVEYNVFENHWIDAQQGPSLMLGTLDNPCTWCFVGDVLFQYNHIDNVFGVFNLVAKYGDAQPMARVAIRNNLCTNLGAAALGNGVNASRVYQIQDDIHDLWIEGNTCFGTTTNYLYASGPAKQRFTFRGNVGGVSVYPWIDGGTFASGALIERNGFVAPPAVLLPGGSVRAGSAAAVGFLNPVWPGGDWTLGSASPFAGMGVDFAELMRRLAGVR